MFHNVLAAITFSHNSKHDPINNGTKSSKMEVFEIMSQISLFSLELLFHESVTATKSLTELV